MNIQRALEQAVSKLSDDFSVHPTGTIIVRSGEERLVILPVRNPDESLWGWKYRIHFADGSIAVAADSVAHVKRLVSKIQQWRWQSTRTNWFTRKVK